MAVRIGDDITGMRFGHLVALRRDGDKAWLCECDCGERKSCKTVSLVNGYDRACGKCGARRAKRRMFTEEEVAMISDMWAKGERVDAIADALGTTNATVYRYATRHRSVLPSRRAGIPEDKGDAISRMWLDDMPSEDIARAVGLDEAVVRRYAASHRDKCPRRIIMLTEEEIEGIVRMGSEGAPFRTIAQYYGVSVATVRRYVRKRDGEKIGGKQ